MSLDVSPDGRTIVFDLLGDLYLLPITGGQAKPLTSGTAWDTQPRFSPDGTRIAFISDQGGIGNLWIIAKDGGQRRLISEVPRNVDQSPILSPTWTPDGRKILVAQRRGTIDPIPLGAPGRNGSQWLLATYEVETGQMRWVGDTASATAQEVLGPVVSRDGRTVYAAVQPPGSGSLVRAWRIERISLGDGTSFPELPPWQGRLGWRPQLSPDGRYLAYVTLNGGELGLRLRNLRDFRERWLLPTGLEWGSWVNRDAGMVDLAPGYSFTPDGRAVIIAVGGRLHRIGLASGHMVEIPFVVQVQRELAPMRLHQFTLPDTAVRTHAVAQPALSPDGTKVAFSALSRIWVMDLPGGTSAGRPRRLTADSVGEFYPSWSPDGRWIAYSTWQDGTGGTVRRGWVADRASSPERLTADPGLYFNTVVARDGRRVLAARADLPPDRLRAWASVERPAISLVSLPLHGGSTAFMATLSDDANLIRHVNSNLVGHPREMQRWPIEQLYLTTDTTRVQVGLAFIGSSGRDWRDAVVLADSVYADRFVGDISGVVSPDGRRALVTQNFSLWEVILPLSPAAGDTLSLADAGKRPFDSPAGAARRWGRAYSPWISWSADGRRVLFVQGGTLFVGDVSDSGWTTFSRVDVPLMVPVDAPRGVVVLRGARVITMAGERERTARRPQILERADIVVRGNRIADIGRSGAVLIPRGATVLDMAGRTILPGFVDIHDHLVVPNGTRPQQWWGALVRLAHGLTAVRDPNELPYIYNETFAYQEEERTGALVAPRIFSTGVSHSGDNQYIKTAEEAREVVQPLAEYFNTETFKEYSSTISRAGRRQIAAAAAAVGLNSTIHGPQLEAIVDGLTGVEHNLQRALYDDVLTFIARSGVTLTNTFGATANAAAGGLTTMAEPWAWPRMRRFVPPDERKRWAETWAFDARVLGHPEPTYVYPMLRSAAGIVARGGRVGIGAHGHFPGLGTHYEMWYHALGGMPPYQILRAATIDGARAIGHANDFGSLEPGKLADLQILDKNPLDDIHNTTSIRYVMKNGRLYQADDLTEIWPRHKPLPSFYLWDTKRSDSTSTAQAQRN
jgi:Tol biopolymer transport system component